MYTYYMCDSHLKLSLPVLDVYELVGLFCVFDLQYHIDVDGVLFELCVPGRTVQSIVLSVPSQGELTDCPPSLLMILVIQFLPSLYLCLPSSFSPLLPLPPPLPPSPSQLQLMNRIHSGSMPVSLTTETIIEGCSKNVSSYDPG